MGYGSYKNVNTEFNLHGPGTIGNFPQRSDPSNDIANILNCPFSAPNGYTDLTGNHTLETGSATLLPTFGYNGEQQMFTLDGAGTVVRTAPGETAHAIGGTDPVTFGFFFRTDFWNSTSSFMNSQTTSNSANYGLIRFVNGNWAFRGATGGGEGSAWRTMINRDPEDRKEPRWYHVAMRCEDGVNEGTFFWNGREVWTGPYGTNGRNTANLSTSQLQFNDGNPTSNNPRFQGYWGNTFVADRALSDQEIKTLADEAFGHSAPNTGY